MNRVPLRARMQLGWQFAKISYHFLMNHKNAFIFTAIPTACFAFFAALFCTALPSFSAAVHDKTIPTQFVVFGLLAVLVYVFIQQLMNVALSFYVSQTLQKQETSITSSIGHACSRSGTILTWAAIDGAIGTLTALFQAKDNNSSLSRALLSMIGSTIQFAWKVLTFFMIPIIALEDKNAFDSLKQSGALMQKTWGQAVGAQFSLGLIFSSFLLAVYALFFGCAYAYAYSIGTFIPGKMCMPPAIFALGILIPLCLVMFVAAPLQIIVRTVLYHYAQHKQTGPFSTALLQNAFAKTDK